MAQSPFQSPKHDGLHVAIIMDGNGRWAQQRGMPRLVGHRAGTENVRRIVSACPEMGIRYLTLYAFSTENWRRPRLEVEGLMRILGEFIERETDNLHAEGVQIRHLGQMDGIPPRLQGKIREAVERTRDNDRLTLAVALNYGGRADIVAAVRAAWEDGVAPEALDEQCITQYLDTRGMPDPDLIVRTSGEYRLSNFLIWQAAYSELWTTPLWWPDFGPDHLRNALADFGRRERRYGGLLEARSAERKA
jgi:undecaprenyl diphosphate synthase